MNMIYEVMKMVAFQLILPSSAVQSMSQAGWHHSFGGQQATAE
jgi:hypothetical protein